MEIKKYTLGVFVVLFTLTGCYKDDSTTFNREVTLVEIHSNVNDTLNFYLGDQIVITPEFSVEEAELTCEWGMGEYSIDPQSGKVSTSFKKIATSKNLAYRTTDLGHFYLRQIVSNSYGNTIRYYHVFVNSEFEEGHLILGRREDGKGSLAFMKALTPEEVEEGLTPAFRQNLFAYINEGKEIEVDPIDCSKVFNHLYILCGEAQRVYQLDAKSFQIRYEYDYKRYQPDFIPLNLITFDGEWCYNLYSTSKNGGVAGVQWSGLDIFPFRSVPPNIIYDKVTHRPDPRSMTSCRACYANTKEGILYASGLDMQNPPSYMSYLPCYNHFVGREIIQLCLDKDLNVLVYSKEGNVYRKTKIGSYITSFSDFSSLDIIFEEVCSTNVNLLTKETQFIPNDLFNCAFFFHENKIYKWFYNQSDIPATPFITLPEGELITTINQSDDHHQLYVGTYNSSRSPLKGSFYIHNTETGARVNTYEGVSDRPVKVMYKVK